MSRRGLPQDSPQFITTCVDFRTQSAINVWRMTCEAWNLLCRVLHAIYNYTTARGNDAPMCVCVVPYRARTTRRRDVLLSVQCFRWKLKGLSLSTQVRINFSAAHLTPLIAYRVKSLAGVVQTPVSKPSGVVRMRSAAIDPVGLACATAPPAGRDFLGMRAPQCLRMRLKILFHVDRIHTYIHTYIH